MLVVQYVIIVHKKDKLPTKRINLVDYWNFKNGVFPDFFWFKLFWEIISPSPKEIHVKWCSDWKTIDKYFYFLKNQDSI